MGRLLKKLRGRCRVYMKTIFKVSVLAVLLVVAPGPCFEGRGGVIHELRMKDFVELENVR